MLAIRTIFLYICLAMSLFFVFSKHKLYHYLLLLSLIFIGFLTASKMCIILMGLVLTIGILYGLLNTNNKQRRWSSIMLFIFMITGFLIFKELIFVFLNNFLKRLGDPSDLNSITTGRYGILKNYFSIYFSNPMTLIFGSGNQLSLLVD